MNLLAFMCTGREPGWDPVCDTSDLVLLALVGIALGSLLAARLSRGQTGATRTMVWLVTMFATFALTMMVGISLS